MFFVAPGSTKQNLGIKSIKHTCSSRHCKYCSCHYEAGLIMVTRLHLLLSGHHRPLKQNPKNPTGATPLEPEGGF